jgi:sterol desaturase/sphingolipid hydroxylase (fatty acid hydroxylase superfamily)
VRSTPWDEVFETEGPEDYAPRRGSHNILAYITQIRRERNRDIGREIIRLCRPLSVRITLPWDEVFETEGPEDYAAWEKDYGESLSSSVARCLHHRA